MRILQTVLDEARRQGVGKITLTGGELLTRPDWQDVIRASLDVCDNLYFITNGLLLDEKKLKWLARERVKRTVRNFITKFKTTPVDIGVAISLDGLEGNKLVRKNHQGKPIDAEIILKRIELATKYGIIVTVNTTITNSLSASELSKMYDILSKMKIDRWQIDQAYIAGRYAVSDLKNEGLEWLKTAKSGYKYIVRNYLKDFPNKLPAWRLEIVQVFRYDMLFYGFNPAKSLDEHPCSYHFGSVIVEKGDEIRFCPSLRTEEIGKLDEHGTFIDAYESSDEFKKFLQGSISDLPCKDCRYGKLFHGGCRANSFSYKGKLWDRDPICCSLSPFVEDEIIPLLPRTLQEQFKSACQAGTRPDER